jgi:predicted transcriptional regulator
MEVAKAAAQIVASHISLNPMPFSAVPALVTKMRDHLVEMLNKGPRVVVEEESDLQTLLLSEPARSLKDLSAQRNKPVSSLTAPEAQTEEPITGDVKTSYDNTEQAPQPSPIDLASFNPNAFRVSKSLVKANNEPANTPRMAESRFRAEYVTAPPTEQPNIPIEYSIWTDKIFCLRCGQLFAALTRHLSVTHHISSDEYREAFGLSPDYPMSCEDYVNTRREIVMAKGSKFRPPTREQRAERRRRNEQRAADDTNGKSS